MTKKTNSPSNEDEVQKINSIGVIASWVGFTPDCRPYKPSNPEIVFPGGLDIVVNVPLSNDLIINANTISMQQISNQKEDKPLFTPLGMRYIIDQFESAMSNSKDEAEETVADNDDWGDEPEAEKEVVKPKNDDEWDDEAETDQPGVEKPEEDFDEDWS